MADFARWTQAAEPALGLNRGAFMHAYLGNRAEAVEITLDASPLTEPLRQMAMEGFEGIATELLKRLTDLVEREDHSQRSLAALGKGTERRPSPVGTCPSPRRCRDRLPTVIGPWASTPDLD